MMASLHDESGLLRVAHPRECNTQQIGETGADRATARATGAQQGSIKALALRALAGNSGATVAQQPAAQGGKCAQQTPPESVALLRCPRAATTQQARVRAVLHRLAGHEGAPAELVDGLSADDLDACSSLGDTELRAFLRAARDADLRARGRRPESETARGQCQHCGPVWLAPEVAAVAPAVGGWPRVLGCPWCHVANRRSIPRPAVTCAVCAHFTPDAVNPAGGMGRCGQGRDVLSFPHAKRECADFSENA